MNRDEMVRLIELAREMGSRRGRREDFDPAGRWTTATRSASAPRTRSPMRVDVARLPRQKRASILGPPSQVTDTSVLLEMPRSCSPRRSRTEWFIEPGAPSLAPAPSSTIRISLSVPVSSSASDSDPVAMSMRRAAAAGRWHAAAEVRPAATARRRRSARGAASVGCRRASAIAVTDRGPRSTHGRRWPDDG